MHTKPAKSPKGKDFARYDISKWSKNERLQRQAEKRQKLLRFLATGQVLASIDVVQELLDIARPSATALGQRLTELRLLKTHRIVDLETRRPKLYFQVTPEGAESVRERDDERLYSSRSRIPAAAHTEHFDLCARAQLKVERAGWLWEAERTLRECASDMKKIPDGIIRGGYIAAIEIEREAKTISAYRTAFTAHLRDMQNRVYDRVIYIHPRQGARGIRNQFRRIEWFRVDGREYEFDAEEHLRDYEFVNWQDWILPEIDFDNE